jgi:N-acetylmuramoyl-L-alanine amidase
LPAVLLAFLAPLLAADAPLPQMVVAIDPGHGGVHHGARGPRGVLEKDVALALARRLAAELEAMGVKSVFTRSDDTAVGLEERTRVANDANADLLVSIHCNSMPTSRLRKRTRGVETYFLSAEATDADAHALAERENADAAAAAPVQADPVAAILEDLAASEAHEDASRLAQIVHQKLIASTGFNDRGVKQAPLTVLMGAKMPAVLVEVGFISHPEEGKLLSRASQQNGIARSLARGIAEFARKVIAKRMAAK